MDDWLNRLQAACDRLHQELATVCASAGRSPHDLELMAVTKTQPAAAVVAIQSLGWTLLGENRVQEAQGKRPLFRPGTRVHLIGHLQSNKARALPGLFQGWESLDKTSTLAAVGKAYGPGGGLEILLEVNTGEDQKQGVRSQDELLSLAEAVLADPRWVLRGLMAMAPLTGDEAQQRRAFAQVRTWRDWLADRLGCPLPVLSMGMSQDWPAAVREGANRLRLGTRLFGGRP